MNKTIRAQPLIFTMKQRQRIDRHLLHLADKIGAPLVMLADISGRLILYRGRLTTTQSTGLAALASGSFAAGQEMGQFLGLRHSFDQQLHEGEMANLYTLAVGSELLLIVAFTKQTMLGMVRVFAQKTQQDLLTITKEVRAARQSTPAERVEDGFTDAVSKQLDDLFA